MSASRAGLARWKAAAYIGRLLRLAVAVGATGVGVAAAQDSAGAAPRQATSTAVRTVDGRVVRPGRDGMIGVPRTWVTVHRVAPDSSGPLDSVRTDGTGRYLIRYRPSGDDAVYFASSMYGGVAYFTPPLPAGDAGADAAEITVFDTTSRPVPIHTRGRHLVVSSSGADGRRTLVEVFELSNDTTVTAVPGPRRRATWGAALAPNATGFQATPSDITPDAVAFRDGRVLVYASIAPGIRQVAFSYSVPASDFPLALPIGEPVSVFELLLEDPGASASGPGLSEQPAASIEGRTFRRFLAQDLKPGATVTIDVGAPTAPTGDRMLLAPVAVVAAVMCLALAFALTRRGPARLRVRGTRVATPTAGAVAGAPRDAAHLARDIAELDEAFARAATPSDDARAEYLRRREALKSQLTAALANEDAAV